MSIFISIGSNCSTRSHIQKYNNADSQITLFFDWLIVDIESVIELFKHYKDFNSYFSKSHIVHIRDANSRAHVKFTKVPTCEFLHDLTPNYTPKKLDEFIEKYKRRYARILEHIYSTTHIYFVFKGYLEHSNIMEFIKTIYIINPRCNFTLTHIIKENTPTQILPNFIQISIAPYIKANFKDKNVDWKELNYNWGACFNTILELTRP